MTSGQETERVYSYNPGACMGRDHAITISPSISIKCLNITSLQRDGTAPQYNSHKIEKPKMSTQLHFQEASL